MSDNDDLPQQCPNTAEEFLRIIVNTMQTLSKRIDGMETKLDRFLSSFSETDNARNCLESDEISREISHLADNVKSLSSVNRVTSGLIIPVGETYIDPNLISNLTHSQVTTQSPDSAQVTMSSEPNFVVIQPSSEICDQLDTPDFRNIEADVQHCLDIANKALLEHPTAEVFVSCLPPRYDREEASRSTDLWNSILMTEAFVHDRLHVVPQSGLECREGKKRYERFQKEGFLLTPYGTKLLSKNVAASILGVIRSIKSKMKVKPVNKTKFKCLLQENRD